MVGNFYNFFIKGTERSMYMNQGACYGLQTITVEGVVTTHFYKFNRTMAYKPTFMRISGVSQIKTMPGYTISLQSDWWRSAILPSK